MNIRLDQITFDAGTQIRAAIDEQVVADYAEAMTTGATFPPIVLFHDGSQHYLGDGFHRFMAAQRNQFREIDADVKPGTKEDALWFALGANRANGKRLTEGDKRHAIVLAFKTWPERSARAIAEQLGANNSWVSEVRSQVLGTLHLPDRVIGRDGKSQPASRSKTPSERPSPARTRSTLSERWDRAREMAADGYSTRQMAQEFGVGLEGLRVRLREHGIDVPADRVIGKSKHHDPNRIIEHIVMDADNLTADIGLIDFPGIDGERLGGWIDSLIAAKKLLDIFIRRLIKEKQKNASAA